jgi:hypothetical protein
MMKKLLYISLLLVCLLAVVGCKNELKGFDLVEHVASLKDNNTYTGYTQEINSKNTEYTRVMQYDRTKNIYKYVYETKVLNPFEAEEQFTILRDEEYYGNGLRYYLEGEIWKTEEFSSSSGTILYSFKKEYFEDAMVLPEMKTENARFEGKLLDDKVDEFFGEDVNVSDVNIIVVFDALMQRLKSITITYQSVNNETMTIITTISYEQVSLTLPD